MELVFDSSTLILLAKIDLLRAVAEEVNIIIPLKVKEENTIKDILDTKVISSLIKEGLIQVKRVSLRGAIKKLCRDFKVQPGEAEALSLAMEKGCPLAVDDRPTIKACKVLNIRFTTAIHFLVKMAEAGKMDRQMAVAKVEKLSFYGRYNRRIIEDALKRLEGGI
jgi:predicted nucleic acid-binding protein